MSLEDRLELKPKRFGDEIRRLRELNLSSTSHTGRVPDNDGNSDMRMSESQQTEHITFIKRLLDRKYASSHTDTAEKQELQHICAQWIVMQQWKLDLTNETLAKRTGIAVEAIQLLQAGLADESLIDEDQWGLLAALLVDDTHDYDCVEAIVYTALGNQTFTDNLTIEEVVTQVVEDNDDTTVVVSDVIPSNQLQVDKQLNQVHSTPIGSSVVTDTHDYHEIHPDQDHEIHPDQGVVHTAMAGMCKRNRWHLLDADELTRRVQALLAGGPEPQPGTPRGTDAAPQQPERPWRTAQAGTRRDPIEGAALHVYSEALYAAYADGTDEERQRVAYHELFHYLFRASYRSAPEFTREEREELAYHVMAELYFRLVASQDAAVLPGVRVTGAFLAFALQQMRNAIRQWRTVMRPWVTLTISEDQPNTANPTIDALPDTNRTHDPVLHVEREERQAQIRHLFTRAIERYPRARIQFHVVWLRLIEQLSYTTIAQRLHMTIENVRVLYCRGIKRLRNEPGFRALAEEEHLIPRHEPAPAFEHQLKIQRKYS